jgi:hypothetical protein
LNCSDELKDQKVPARQQESYTRGKISGLAITSGVPQKFLFDMSMKHVKIGMSLEILRLMKDGRMSVKEGSQMLATAKNLQVKFFDFRN